MYALPYSTSDVEPRHYKLEWLSLLGAVAAALALLVVAYFINNQDGLQKVAFICIVVAGFTVALCLAALFAHYYVGKHRPKAGCDDPPSYKDSWGRAFYSRRMTEVQDPEDNCCNTSFTLLPRTNTERQCESSSNVLPLDSSGYISPCTPAFLPHSSHTATHLASSSFLCCHHHITCSTTSSLQHCVDESQVTGDTDPPCYDEAMQSMDLPSLQKLRRDIEIESDQ